jgi:hypothetical protein
MESTASTSVCSADVRANEGVWNVPTSMSKPVNVESDDCLSLSDALTVVASNNHASSCVDIYGRVRWKRCFVGEHYESTALHVSVFLLYFSSACYFFMLPQTVFARRTRRLSLGEYGKLNYLSCLFDSETLLSLLSRVFYMHSEELLDEFCHHLSRLSLRSQHQIWRTISRWCQSSPSLSMDGQDLFLLVLESIKEEYYNARKGEGCELEVCDDLWLDMERTLKKIHFYSLYSVVETMDLASRLELQSNSPTIESDGQTASSDSHSRMPAAATDPRSKRLATLWRERHRIDQAKIPVLSAIRSRIGQLSRRRDCRLTARSEINMFRIELEPSTGGIFHMIQNRLVLPRLSNTTENTQKL